MQSQQSMTLIETQRSFSGSSKIEEKQWKSGSAVPRKPIQFKQRTQNPLLQDTKVSSLLAQNCQRSLLPKNKKIPQKPQPLASLQNASPVSSCRHEDVYDFE